MVVTMDTGMDTSLSDRLVGMLIPNKVERGGQTASTSFNIHKKQKKLEWLVKQSLIKGTLSC